MCLPRDMEGAVDDVPDGISNVRTRPGYRGAGYHETADYAPWEDRISKVRTGAFGRAHKEENLKEANDRGDGWRWVGERLPYDVYYRFAGRKGCVEFKVEVTDLRGERQLQDLGMEKAAEPEEWAYRLDVPSIRRAFGSVEHALLFSRDIPTYLPLSAAQRTRALQFFKEWMRWSDRAEEDVDEHHTVGFHLRRWDLRDGPRVLFRIRPEFRVPEIQKRMIHYHPLRYALYEYIYAVDLMTADTMTGVLASAWGGTDQARQDNGLSSKFMGLPPLRVQVLPAGPEGAVAANQDPNAISPSRHVKQATVKGRPMTGADTPVAPADVAMLEGRTGCEMDDFNALDNKVFGGCVVQ